MRSGSGLPQDGTGAVEPAMTDPEGPAAFLAVVRTLVHGERIHPQRPDSDAWAGPAELLTDTGSASSLPAPEALTEDPGDWLPGQWVAEPRRRRAVSGKSAKSYRGRRRRRTVEPSALEGAPGTEVRVTATPRAPEFEPTATPPSSDASSDASVQTPPAAEPAPEPVREHAPEPRPDPRRTPGREGRREKRREAALAKAVAAARVGGPTDARDEARARRESLEDFLVRVEAPHLPQREPRTPRWIRRTVSMSVVATLIAGGAVLPWAAPEVRDWMAGLVPDQGADVVRIEDPPVAPSTEAFIGPVGVNQQAGSLAGVRLEAAGPPLEVRIPRLGVDSEVVPISGQSGTLLPPDDPQVLGWWQEGKPVGAQYGTSVVTGHAVHTGGGALDQLGELVAGDSLRVRTDAGWIRYVVQRTRIYSKGALADDAESIFRLGGPGRLVLISCDDWNGEIFESNAVVYATPAADLPFETEVPDGGPDAAGEEPSGNMDGGRGVLLREPVV